MIFVMEIQVFVFVVILLTNGTLNSIPVAVHYQVLLGPLSELKYSGDSKSNVKVSRDRPRWPKGFRVA